MKENTEQTREIMKSIQETLLKLKVQILDPPMQNPLTEYAIKMPVCPLPGSGNAHLHGRTVAPEQVLLSTPGRAC